GAGGAGHATGRFRTSPPKGDFLPNPARNTSSLRKRSGRALGVCAGGAVLAVLRRRSVRVVEAHGEAGGGQAAGQRAVLPPQLLGRAAGHQLAVAGSRGDPVEDVGAELPDLPAFGGR